MRTLTDAHTFTVADTPGIYHHSAGVVSTRDGLVCVYRTCDEHVASWSNINVAFSRDGGRTWFGHKVIAESGSVKTGGCWVAPQTSLLPDGGPTGQRIAVLADFGVQTKPFEWPMLSHWQKPPLGMRNHLFLSSDGGKTWQQHQVDTVGGEPSYIIPLSNGSLLYTRTDSAPTTAKKNPAMPWGANYYKSTGVFSDDGGKTFTRTVPIFDDPLIGDCEVGIVEYAPGTILAMSRVGDNSSGFGQPSRISISEDYGKTWSKPRLAPIYAHRPCVGKLMGAKREKPRLFISYRNASGGTTGTMGWAFDPETDYGYQPGSFIWDESVCQLRDRVMHLNTTEGQTGAAEFILYPLEDDDSSATLEATLAVDAADRQGCVLSCGTSVSITPDRLFLTDRPSDGFAFDARQMHTYRLVAEGGKIRVLVDGTEKLNAPLEGIFHRNIRFGNRNGKRGVPEEVLSKATSKHRQKGAGYYQNAARTRWQVVRAVVKNRRDHSIDWKWEAASGKYPDQFRRDQVVLVERNASFGPGNSGYSGWCQLPDQTVVIADYTVTAKDLDQPILRAYRLDENML